MAKAKAKSDSEAEVAERSFSSMSDVAQYACAMKHEASPTDFSVWKRLQMAVEAAMRLNK